MGPDLSNLPFQPRPFPVAPNKTFYVLEINDEFAHDGAQADVDGIRKEWEGMFEKMEEPVPELLILVGCHLVRSNDLSVINIGPDGFILKREPEKEPT